MFAMNVPKYLWRDAILTIAFLINRLPSCTLTFKSPLCMLTNKFPHLNMLTNTLPLKTFGCIAFFHIHSQYWTWSSSHKNNISWLFSNPRRVSVLLSPNKENVCHPRFHIFWKIPNYSHTSLQGGIEIEKLSHIWDPITTYCYLITWDCVATSRIRPELTSFETSPPAETLSQHSLTNQS